MNYDDSLVIRNLYFSSKTTIGDLQKLKEIETVAKVKEQLEITLRQANRLETSLGMLSRMLNLDAIKMPQAPILGANHWNT